MVIGDLVLLEKILSQKAGDSRPMDEGLCCFDLFLTFGLSLRCAWMEAAFSDERCLKKLR